VIFGENFWKFLESLLQTFIYSNSPQSYLSNAPKNIIFGFKMTKLGSLSTPTKKNAQKLLHNPNQPLFIISSSSYLAPHKSSAFFNQPAIEYRFLCFLKFTQSELRLSALTRDFCGFRALKLEILCVRRI
jgi:hypothetical protein